MSVRSSLRLSPEFPQMSMSDNRVAKLQTSKHPAANAPELAARSQVEVWDATPGVRQPTNDACSREIESCLGAFAATFGLSHREQLVFRKAALEGKEDKEVACDIGCAFSTVGVFWFRLLRKTGFRTKRRLISHFWTTWVLLRLLSSTPDSPHSIRSQL